ncbi:MAG: hypothetical protein D6722_05705 [Bacteroidetes bacterium]|nr:MAG: hypothetical protein D6722_05705 [Bacteroidota bacterium]
MLRTAIICWSLLLLLGSQPLQGQEAPSRWEINGYTKYLNSTTFTGLPAGALGSPLTTNLVHHRLNLTYFASESWSFSAGLRNRLFFADGQQSVLGAAYARQVDQYEGLLDLSVRWAENDYVVLHSLVDRAYVSYSQGKWDVRAGRQRINWGVNLVWNPNDLFNALNFFDFDYEERPGNDAIRIQYFPGLLSRAEVAVAPGRYDSTTVAAGLYRFNTHGYDIQVLGGYFKGDLALGLGWEGNLGDAGFKGEGTWFYALEEQSWLPRQALSATLSADYVFGNGLYLSGGVLYNRLGDTTRVDFSNPQAAEGSSLFGNSLAGGALSAKNLFPATWSGVLTVSGNITPLFAAGGTVIYSPAMAASPFFDPQSQSIHYATTRHLTAVIPTLTYSIRENWDLDLIGQVFLAEDQESYKHLASSVFLRLKWSY